MDICIETDRLLIHTCLNDLIQTFKCSTADKQNVGGIDLDQLLMGMLSSTLRWYGCNGSLQDLQKSLLYALSGYISGDGRVL